jgi:hypothetical protein
MNCCTPLDPELPPDSGHLPESWVYALVERRRGNGDFAKRWEIIDLDLAAEKRSGGNPRYRCDSLQTIRRKCLFAATFLPMYTAAYMVWHAVRAPLSALNVFFQTFEEFINQPTFYALVKLVFAAPLQAARCFWFVVRAPFCSIAMQFAAFYGIVRPLEGRKHSAAVERFWKMGAAYKDDFRRMESNENVHQFVWRACTAKDFPHPFYIAECFQPMGTLNDDSIVSVRFSTERESQNLEASFEGDESRSAIQQEESFDPPPLLDRESISHLSSSSPEHEWIASQNCFPSLSESDDEQTSSSLPEEAVAQ